MKDEHVARDKRGKLTEGDVTGTKLEPCRHRNMFPVRVCCLDMFKHETIRYRG